MLYGDVGRPPRRITEQTRDSGEKRCHCLEIIILLLRHGFCAAAETCKESLIMDHQVTVPSELPITYWVLSEQPNHTIRHLWKPFYHKMGVAYTKSAQVGQKDTRKSPEEILQMPPPFSGCNTSCLSTHTCGLLWNSLTS